jgi:hypothetical protein
MSRVDPGPPIMFAVLFASCGLCWMVLRLAFRDPPDAIVLGLFAGFALLLTCLFHIGKDD